VEVEEGSFACRRLTTPATKSDFKNKAEIQFKNYETAAPHISAACRRRG
jgi:hypothetical protein